MGDNHFVAAAKIVDKVFGFPNYLRPDHLRNLDKLIRQFRIQCYHILLFLGEGFGLLNDNLKFFFGCFVVFLASCIPLSLLIRVID